MTSNSEWTPYEQEFDRVDSVQGFLTMTRFFGRHHLVYGADIQNDSVDGYKHVRDLETEIETAGDPKFPNDSNYQQGGAFAIFVYQPLKGINIRSGLRFAFANLEGTLAEPLGFQRLENDQVSDFKYN